jgi:hypothetical protein
VDDLLTTLGVLVMIEQQVVLWSLTIYKPPTLAVFYVVVLSGPTVIWYVHPSCCHSSIGVYVFFSFFRLARGSILASIIRIISCGPLRVGALYVSGLLLMLYLVTIAQIIWVCQMNEKQDHTGYVSFCGSHFEIISVSYCYEWSSSSLPHCMNKKQVAILQMTGDSLRLSTSSSHLIRP